MLRFHKKNSNDYENNSFLNNMITHNNPSNATDVGTVVSLGNALQEKLNIKLSVVENDVK